MDSPRKYSSYTALIEDKRRHQMSLSPSRNTTTHHSPVSPVVNSPIRYTSSPTSGDNFKSQTALAEAKRRHKTELKYSPTKTKPIPVASPPRTPSGTATPLEIGSPGSLSSRSSECSSRRHHHHHSHQHNAAVQVPEVKKSPPSTPPLKYPHKWPSARTPPRTPEHQKHEHTEDHHHHHHSNSPCHHLSQNNFESDKRLHRTPLHHPPPLKEKSPEPKLRTVEGDPLHLSYHQLEHEKAQHRTPLRSASPDLLVQKPQANPIYNVDVWTDPRSHTQFEVAKSGNFIGSPLQPERPGNTRHLDSPRTP